MLAHKQDLTGPVNCESSSVLLFFFRDTFDIAMSTATRKSRLKTDGEEDSQVSYQSSSTATAQRRALPIHVQKALAEEIEANGGLSSFAGSDNQRFAALLNSKVDEQGNPFGQRGDSIRRVLQQKLYGWKQLQKDGLYEEKVLNILGVQSFKNRPIHSADRLRKTPKKQDDDRSSESSAESDPRIYAKTSKFPPKTKAKKQSSPPKQILVPSQQESITPLKSPPLLRQKETKAMALPKGTASINIYEGVDFYADGFHVFWDDELEALDRKTFFLDCVSEKQWILAGHWMNPMQRIHTLKQ
jgi:hypothetical protein